MGLVHCMQGIVVGKICGAGVGRILVDAGLVHFMHGIVVARGVLW